MRWTLSSSDEGTPGQINTYISHPLSHLLVRTLLILAAVVIHWLLKPKFHYADFRVTSATSPRQTRDVPFSPDSIYLFIIKIVLEVQKKKKITPTSQNFPGNRHSGIWPLLTTSLATDQHRL